MTFRIVMAVALIALVAVGCSTQSPMQSNGSELNAAQYDNSVAPSDAAPPSDPSSKSLDASASAGFGRGGWHRHDRDMVTFTVRVENVSTATTLHLSNGETAPAPHSPGVWAITHRFNPFFRIGHLEPGIGLEQQAEDGDPSVLGANIGSQPGVVSSGIFTTPVGDSQPGPATPGKAFEFDITAKPGDHLSLTTMFGQSNDLFYSPGPVGIPLFKWGSNRPVDGNVTRYFRLWDAGTEVNQEPGLGPDQAPRQSAPDTGESESKPVLPVHDQYTYPRTNQVIKVTITPHYSSNDDNS